MSSHRGEHHYSCQFPVLSSQSPRVPAAAWRPKSQSATQLCDLPGVIAVVRHHLPEDSTNRRRMLYFRWMHRFYLSLHSLRPGLGQQFEIAEKTGETVHSLAPLSFPRRSWVRWPALRGVIGISRSTATDSPDLVVHPVIHVRHQLPDGVNES